MGASYLPSCAGSRGGCEAWRLEGVPPPRPKGEVNRVGPRTGLAIRVPAPTTARLPGSRHSNRHSSKDLIYSFLNKGNLRSGTGLRIRPPN